jgi:hypothetical protein
MPGAGTATMAAVFLMVMAIVVIAVCRKLAEVIKDINRYDQGYIPTKRKKR